MPYDTLIRETILLLFQPAIYRAGFFRVEMYIRLRCLLTPAKAAGEDKVLRGGPSCAEPDSSFRELGLLFLLQNLHEGK